MGTCGGPGPGGSPWCTGSDVGCNTGPEHFVWISDKYGCAEVQYKFQANTPQEAQACADAEYAKYDSSYSEGPLDTDRDCVNVCEVFQGNTTQLTNICGYGQQALDTCAFAHCIDCESYFFGTCP